MFNLKKITKRQRYITIAVIIVLLGIVALFTFMILNNKTTTNSEPIPQNGSYKITETRNIICDLSYPPMCAGTISLTSGNSTPVKATIDRSTKVQYQNKEIQVYPTELEDGMIGQVTFKPNSNTIDTVTIVD